MEKENGKGKKKIKHMHIIYTGYNTIHYSMDSVYNRSAMVWVIITWCITIIGDHSLGCVKQFDY